LTSLKIWRVKKDILSPKARICFSKKVCLDQMNDREQTQTIRFAIIFIIIYIILVEANCSFVLIWFKPKLITHVRFEYNFFFFITMMKKKSSDME